LAENQLMKNDKKDNVKYKEKRIIKNPVIFQTLGSTFFSLFKVLFLVLFPEEVPAALTFFFLTTFLLLLSFFNLFFTVQKNRVI